MTKYISKTTDMMDYFMVFRANYQKMKKTKNKRTTTTAATKNIYLNNYLKKLFNSAYSSILL